MTAVPIKDRTRTKWALMSNHGHVLVCIAGDPDVRLRHIANQVGITERAVFGIIEDLESAGILERVRVGRCNRYIINTDGPLRHPITADVTVGELLGLFTWSASERRASAS